MKSEVPEGWEKKELGELCDIKIGGTPSRNDETYWDINKFTKNLWASIKDLDSAIIHDTEEHISDKGVKNSNVKLIKKGTLLMSFKLTIGRVAFVGKNLYTNEAIAALIPRNEKHVSKVFLFYILPFIEPEKYCETAVKGKTLNLGKLQTIVISIPKSFKEQQKIASILLTIDKAIEKTKALIEKNKKIKQGLMKDLFESVINQGKKERIKDIAKVKGGKRMPKGKDFAEFPTPYPYLRVIDFKDESIDLSDLKYVTPRDEALIRRYKISSNDVYVTIAGTIGLVGNVPEKLNNAQLTENAAKITGFNKSRINKLYLTKFMNYDFVQNQIWREIGIGGGVPKLALFRIEKLRVCIPDRQVQDKIVEKIYAINKKIHSEQSFLDKLLKIKSGIMQDLLTGKVRVKVGAA